MIKNEGRKKTYKNLKHTTNKLSKLNQQLKRAIKVRQGGLFKPSHTHKTVLKIFKFNIKYEITREKKV